jgi:8-oxo-dGTP pyrophosphatase MutT (NUDIX family)
MWIMTIDGFYSAVQKSGETELTIRARSMADLIRLKEKWLPELHGLQAGGGTDYPARARCTHQAWAEALAKMGAAIDYSNFKSKVAKTLGHDRADTYHEVWARLHAIEKEPGAGAAPPRRPEDGLGGMTSAPAEFGTTDSTVLFGPKPKKMRVAYGGVVLSEDRTKVLLREPRNHFGGYVWTFAKGGAETGETPLETALREVRDEMGVVARPFAVVPRWFEGDTSVTAFFLMDVVETGLGLDAETARVEWVRLDQAGAYLEKNTSAKGRARDLTILDAVREAIR